MTRRFTRILMLTATAAFVLATVVLSAPAPAQAAPAFKLKVNYPSPDQVGEVVTMRAVARRNSGSPIKGARVRFTWNVAGTVFTVKRVTNAKGVATSRRVMTCAGTVSVRVRAVWKGHVRAAVPVPVWEVPGST